VYPGKDDALDDLEYEDVPAGSYQLWEHPAGRIYSILPDRSVEAGKEWSLASADTWSPVLSLVATEPAKVDDAYKRLAGDQES